MDEHPNTEQRRLRRSFSNTARELGVEVEKIAQARRAVRAGVDGLEREADYHPQPTVADLAANPQTREDVEAAATAPPRIDPVREPMITSRTALKHHVAPLRFGGYLVGTGRAVLDELERELTEASRAEILEWCVGQLDGEPLDDDAHYRFEIDKLGSDLVMRTVMYLRRYCTLRPEGRE